MSTTPVTPSLDDLRAAAVAAEVPAVPTVPAAPAPVVVPEPVANPNEPVINQTADGRFEIVLPTGGRYLGATAQEAALNLARGKVEADRTIQTLRQPAPDPAPQAPQVAPEVAAARSYLLDELAQGIGLPNGQALIQKFNELGSVGEAHSAEQVASGFYQLAPDFPNNPQNVDLLTGMVDQMGLPMTPYGLQAAHLIAVSQGKYKPLTQQEVQLQRMQALGINPSTIVPPTPAPVLPGQAPNAQNSDSFNPYDKKNSLEDVRRWALGNQ
jgi:hypothetical protein